jgi:DNA-binding transcriptional ArsR family regulator
MTFAKLAVFTEQQQQIAKLAKALSHPARVAILEHLAKVGVCISGDIANELPLARATVSQHLQELKAAGLIKGTIEGQTICYCIDPEGYQQLIDHLGGFTTNNKPTSCC